MAFIGEPVPWPNEILSKDTERASSLIYRSIAHNQPRVAFPILLRTGLWLACLLLSRLTVNAPIFPIDPVDGVSCDISVDRGPDRGKERPIAQSFE